MSKVKPMIGLRFGKLLVESQAGRHEKTRRMLWNCVCDCGNHHVADGVYLRSGHIKSCGCLSKNRLGDLTRSKDSGFNSLFRSYTGSANKRGYKFELTKEEFRYITSQKCHYCGQEPSNVRIKHSKEGAYVYNGVDRLDNSDGYTLDNCVACCTFCNFLKKDIPFNDFLKKITEISKNMKLL